MSQTSASQPPAVADNTQLGATTETSRSSEESVQNVTPQPEVAQSYKTVQLLKEWPVVMHILNKAQETYKTVKHSTKFTETGFSISEKVGTSLAASSGNVIQKLTPVLKVVDYSASEGLERLQKFFPIVKESPEKIYDSVVKRVVKLIGPAVNTAVSMTEVGRRQLKITTKSLIKSSRKVITLVENRLETLEKYLAGNNVETVAAPSAEVVTGTDGSLEQASGRLRRCAGAALAASGRAALLAVGGCFWLLESLPLVGRRFAEAPSPASASPSPSRSKQPSTSSYHSLADEPAAEQPQAHGSLLPPQLSQATQ